MNPIIPLIMCGGSGTRLWPASREGRPKQFLPLLGQYSTFQETLRRVNDSTLFGRSIVMTNRQYRFLVAEQVAAINIEVDIVLEPVRRDSGPAIAAGAMFALKRDGDPIIVALAADHVIDDSAAFTKTCVIGSEAAAERIVTFGVRPTRRRLNTAISSPVLHWARTFTRSRSSLRNPTLNPWSITSRTVTCGTAAILFFVPNRYSTNTAFSNQRVPLPSLPRSRAPVAI